MDIRELAINKIIDETMTRVFKKGMKTFENDYDLLGEKLHDSLEAANMYRGTLFTGSAEDDLIGSCRETYTASHVLMRVYVNVALKEVIPLVAAEIKKQILLELSRD
jgi:hypothetical protein